MVRVAEVARRLPPSGLPAAWFRSVLYAPGWVFPTATDKLSETLPLSGAVISLMRGGRTTNTVKLRVALKEGIPLSLTRMVMVLVLGVCCGEGVHVNKPSAGSIVAPEGAFPSRANE